MSKPNPRYWPSARHFTEAVQCPGVSFTNKLLRETLPAVDRLGMPLVTSGQFAYVYKLKSKSAGCDFAVRCFRGYLGDRDQRYMSIEKHIQTYPLPFLSGFTYEPEGILVGGQRFPILFMKWIEGPTLDLYLEKMVGRRDVLLYLAEEWIKLIGVLREAGIAHGDLQHGNIIVERGKLRLVDHDGMFVPLMAGWSSSELGHQHYQHPRRDAQLFNAGLDNFSALVIYLTLLSLAEQPTLWAEHHDENLIFTKTDFIDPASSSLFAKIKSIGPEHQRLAEVLEEAAKGEPANVPCLLDLASVKSSLPSWMNAPVDLEPKTQTREVAQTGVVFQRQDSRWIPWQAKSSVSALPSTPKSAFVQTIFSGPTSPTPATKGVNITDPTQIWNNTLAFAKDLAGSNFLWWYWGMYLFLEIFGFSFVYAMLIALVCLATVCLTYGYMRAREAALDALRATPLVPNSPRAVAPVSSIPLRQAATYQLPPDSITLNQPMVGNRVLNIYHLQDCRWVDQISPKNRIGFSVHSEALSAGYKPCQICLPLH